MMRVNRIFGRRNSKSCSILSISHARFYKYVKTGIIIVFETVPIFLGINYYIFAALFMTDQKTGST